MGRVNAKNFTEARHVPNPHPSASAETSSNALPSPPTNNNINFLTGAGAFLQQFIFGYAGLRFSSDAGLSRRFEPMMPERISRLKLRNVWIRGKRIDIIVPGAK